MNVLTRIAIYTICLFYFINVIHSFSIITINKNGNNKPVCKKFNATSPHSFDYFLLSIQWPGSACIGQQNCHVPTFVKEFTIHGLWPNSLKDVMGPTCCYNEALNEKLFSSLIPTMQTNWPSYYHPNEQFWDHEWLKHGTCAKNVSATNGQFNYFSSTLQLHSQLNLFNILQRNQIVPSDSITYNRDKIEYILQKNNIPGLVACTKDGRHLEEIRFCVDKSLRVVPCAPNQVNDVHTRNRCSSDIYYPTIKYKSLN
ncbi:hypothetical protein ABK040_002777 [Willaertia magna]